jgi:RNA polymerase sigma-70 factor (ECF subfamily)
MPVSEKQGAIDTLLESRRSFLAYLERKVGDPAMAEDILQDAFAKVVARPELAPDDERLVPWFYRSLKNATIDQYRRRGAATRALEAFARELQTMDLPDPELQSEICACVSRLARTLKPEYADALRAVEIDGIPVKDFAAAKGLTAGNAAVRTFRAREALKKRVEESCGICADHGCTNCTCRASS